MFSQFVFVLKNPNQASCSLFGQHEISVLIELTFGHLRYHLTDVPPQPNTPSDYVFYTDQPSKKTTLDPKLAGCCLPAWLVGCLPGWPSGCLAGWLAGWLSSAGWLAGFPLVAGWLLGCG